MRIWYFNNILIVSTKFVQSRTKNWTVDSRVTFASSSLAVWPLLSNHCVYMKATSYEVSGEPMCTLETCARFCGHYTQDSLRISLFADDGSNSYAVHSDAETVSPLWQQTPAEFRPLVRCVACSGLIKHDLKPTVSTFICSRYNYTATEALTQLKLLLAR